MLPAEEHEATLREALLQGINVIDTSANYGDGEAEEAIGVVLRDLIEAGSVARDSVLLVSKVGYIQGQNLARYESGEVVTPETVHYGQGIKHCIHPDFMYVRSGRQGEMGPSCGAWQLTVADMPLCLPPAMTS